MLRVQEKFRTRKLGDGKTLRLLRHKKRPRIFAALRLSEIK